MWKSRAPGCAHESPQQCVTAALEAMGGGTPAACGERRLQTVGHALADGSNPLGRRHFITSYERDRTTVDLAKSTAAQGAKLDVAGIRSHQRIRYPRCLSALGRRVHTKFGDSPCPGDLDASREAAGVGPAAFC